MKVTEADTAERSGDAIFKSASSNLNLVTGTSQGLAEMANRQRCIAQVDNRETFVRDEKMRCPLLSMAMGLTVFSISHPLPEL